MDSPAQRDIQDSISGVESMVSRIENKVEYQEVRRAIAEGEYVVEPKMARWKTHNKRVRALNAGKEYMQEYMSDDRHRLGRVVAASGFRQEASSTSSSNPNSYPTVRDWALVRARKDRSFGTKPVSPSSCF